MKPGIYDPLIPGARPCAVVKCALCDAHVAPDREFAVAPANFKVATRCCQECAGLFGVFLDALMETAGTTLVPSHRYASARFVPPLHEYSQ
jgi:hypothetical protein